MIGFRQSRPILELRVGPILLDQKTHTLSVCYGREWGVEEMLGLGTIIISSTPRLVLNLTQISSIKGKHGSAF